MTASPGQSGHDLSSRIVAALRARFSLKDDRANDVDIDTRLRGDVLMQGTNLWVLMFAIFIASIGLNVNSTAVIIGAMLISPLMGPIMGVGYGVGILDLPLARKSLQNLGIATLIALGTSTAYFAISPLTTAHSELLSRTTPTIWDVLVAVFGGLAGIVAATRRRKSNVIPGVAIATALMPPLCTAGYGLATGAWGYFLGAFYLFTINCVFIAASSALVTRAFHVQRKAFVDPRTEARVRLFLGVVVVVTMLPSLYLAYRLVGDEVFRNRANQFVHDQLEFPETRVTDVNVDPHLRTIEVSLIGKHVPQASLAGAVSRLASAGLDGANLRVFQAGDTQVDVATLRSGVLSDLYKASRADLSAKEHALEDARRELAAIKSDTARFQAIPTELHALFPQLSSVIVSEAPEWVEGKGFSDRNTVVLNLQTGRALARSDRLRLEQWLRARTGAASVRVVVGGD